MDQQGSRCPGCWCIRRKLEVPLGTRLILANRTEAVSFGLMQVGVSHAARTLYRVDHHIWRIRHRETDTLDGNRSCLWLDWSDEPEPMEGAPVMPLKSACDCII
jgi:hypothetical protein